MFGQKQVETAVIHNQNWIITFVYISKPNPVSPNKKQEKITITVSSIGLGNLDQFMYSFQVKDLKDYGLVGAKIFKDLKEFLYFFKFNPESFSFKQERGEGMILVMYVKEGQKKGSIAKITKGVRFIRQDPESIEKKKRIKDIQAILKQQKQAFDRLNENYKQFSDYSLDTTLVIENAETIKSEEAKRVKKIVIKQAYISLESEQSEMKNDREMDRIGINKILQTLPTLTQLQSLTIQWHKMSTSKAILEIIRACSKLKLKVLNFDNQGNAFTQKQCFKEINEVCKQNFQNLQQLSIFFNISQEGNYFDESCMHIEHTEKYRGKTQILPSQWSHFILNHEKINSIWIAKNSPADIILLNIKRWKKLALGYYEDQEMKPQYWDQLRKYYVNDNKELTSLCLTRIKDIQSETLSFIIQQSPSLQYLMLNGCQGAKEKALQQLGKCKNIKYINIKHAPLQDNGEINCKFLTQINTLQFLNIDNLKDAKKAIHQYLSSEKSKRLKSLGLPRNNWINNDILSFLPINLTKLNLYNIRLSEESNYLDQAVKSISKCQKLKVLNLGATQFTLKHIATLVKKLKYLKKLNISDINCQKRISQQIYDKNNKEIYKNKEIKKYNEMSKSQKQQFLTLFNNNQMSQILLSIPRVTHFDIRNLGIDERPFSDPKIAAPSLRYIGCEFDLYKKIQTLGRRGITFV